MSTIIEHDENGSKINFLVPDNIIDISADGIGPSMIGFPFTKITFYQARLVAKGATPIREVVATINIPTSALLQFAELIKTTLKENSEPIHKSVEGFKEFIK